VSDELVKTLQARVGELTAEVSELKGESKDRRLKGKKVADDLEKLTREHAALLADRDQWKGKAESSQPELTARISELQGKLREVTHKDAFRKAAEAKGVMPEAVDAAWQLSRYEPAADAVDAAAIDAAVAKTTGANPFLLKPAAPPAAGEAAAAAARPPVVDPLTGAVAGGRGGPDNGSMQLRVTPQQYGDPAWMDANSARLAEASKNGTLVVS